MTFFKFCLCPECEAAGHTPHGAPTSPGRTVPWCLKEEKDGKAESCGFASNNQRERREGESAVVVPGAGGGQAGGQGGRAASPLHPQTLPGGRLGPLTPAACELRGSDLGLCRAAPGLPDPLGNTPAQPSGPWTYGPPGKRGLLGVTATLSSKPALPLCPVGLCDYQ